jgi:SWI/SNF-related matrix-associated actin-dependent regulator 1 of chromatin subfamily A
MDMAHDIDPVLNFDRYLPEGRNLKDFQHVGVMYALWATQEGKGTWIADEQGLGKTIQAQVAAMADAARKGRTIRTLCIVKASIKANWAREWSLNGPDCDVQVLGGTRPYQILGDVVIISFNLLKVWQDALIDHGFDQVIIDESHNVKDPRTQQTKAALRISESVRARQGMVLLLSGTPLLNRPVELLSQLMMMGRLEEVSPAPWGKANPTARDWEFAFKNTFCDPKKNDYGKTEYKGGSRLQLLDVNTRSHCKIRRMRNEVLNMNDTHRVPVSLSLNGDLNHYWNVEKSFVPKNDNSATIELITALRQAVATCKIPAAIEWVADFIETNAGDDTTPAKKLVVWADHIEVQVKLTEALQAAGISACYLKGAQDKGQIQQAIDTFNQGDTQVLVCSLKAHGFGHTFVGNGHNVTDCLFVEQPWHPGAVTQAEDRINRIGQNAEAVFAHTLLVPGTIDEWLSDLINAKWETFKAAIDGTIPTWEEDDILAQLAAKLEAHLRAKYGDSHPALPKTTGEDVA